MTILIVEDDNGVQIVWKHFLRGLPVNVLCVSTLSGALAEMEKMPPPDLILLDLHLLDSTAEKTVQSIKDFTRINPHSVIIVLTGDTDSKLRQAATALGADFYSTKMEIQSQIALFHALEEAINRPSPQRKAPPFKESVELLEKITQFCVEHAEKHPQNEFATLQLPPPSPAPHPDTNPFRVRDV
jgi:CheY-like chemotaxis protein